MFTKEITYTDYDGKVRKETFLFNLNKAELAEMELSTAGGMHEMLKKIMETEDMPQIVKIFKNLILKSYGVKSDDGKRFIKSEQLSEEFSQTEAYSELFMELAQNPDAAAAFVNGVIPAEMSAQVEEAMKTGNTPQIAEVAKSEQLENRQEMRKCLKYTFRKTLCLTKE